MQDLTGGSNLVISGFALSVVSGMQVLVSVGICWANGLRAATIATTLTINATTTQPRYTLVRVTVTPNNPNGTDGTTGNNLIADTNVVDFLDGTPGASPAKPTLSSAYQVQVGSILLPAGTSALTGGMLNTLDCAPNSQGPDGSELVSSFQHRAQNMSIATTHGVRTEWGDTPAVSADSSGNHNFIVGFPTAFNNTPTVIPAFTNFVPAAGATITVTNRTSTGCTIAIQGAGNGATVQASWSAFGI